MKIVSHKFKKNQNEIGYLVNLVDVNGHPLESHLAKDFDECLKITNQLTKKFNIKNISHNTNFSLIQDDDN